MWGLIGLVVKIWTLATAACRGRCRFEVNNFKDLTRCLFELDQTSTVVPFTCNSYNTNQKLIDPVLPTDQTSIKLHNLLQAYDTNNANVITPATHNFVNELMATDVMQKLETYLNDNNILPIGVTLKAKVMDIWFTVYRRQRKSSSGFKHVFYGELGPKSIGGLHNWISFTQKQNPPHDLYSYNSCQDLNLNNKGELVSMTSLTKSGFTAYKKTIFVGTSPELEMALYTACFLVMPNQLCQVYVTCRLSFNIQSHTKSVTTNGLATDVVGSTYPMY